MKRKRINIQLYFQELEVIILDDYSELNSVYNTDFSNNDYEGFVFIYNEVIVLALKSTQWSVICHEIVHIVNEIFIRCNIQLDRENDEPQAYLTGFIANEINEFLNVIE